MPARIELLLDPLQQHDRIRPAAPRKMRREAFEFTPHHDKTATQLDCRRAQFPDEHRRQLSLCKLRESRNDDSTRRVGLDRAAVVEGKQLRRSCQ